MPDVAFLTDYQAYFIRYQSIVLVWVGGPLLRINMVAIRGRFLGRRYSVLGYPCGAGVSFCAALNLMVST